MYTVHQCMARRVLSQDACGQYWTIDTASLTNL